jgi:hypothetical protein
MLGASASFITPTGYQTNMMVLGPGGYKYRDFPTIGIPLQIWCLLITCGVTLTVDFWYVWVIVELFAIFAFLAGARVFPYGPFSRTAFRSAPAPKDDVVAI